MLGLEFVRPSRRQWILLGAVTMGLLARVPGVFWGANFPTGWTSHHIDEYTHLSVVGCIVNPVALHQPSAAAYIYGCASYYPKGTAAHVAALLLAVRAVQGKLTRNLVGDDCGSNDIARDLHPGKAGSTHESGGNAAE
jgi:hypothetical protein